MGGYTKPYFTDDTGRLYRDETGNLDDNDSIPMEIDFGRDNLGTDQTKGFMSLLVNSENARGAQLQYSIDGGSFQTFPDQITQPVQAIVYPQGGQRLEGRDIDYKIVHNDRGDAPAINGITTFRTLTEMFVTEASQ